MKKILLSTLIAAASMMTLAGQAHAGTTLDAVKKKGFVQCGISDGLPVSLTLIQKGNSPVSTLTSVVPSPPPFLVMRKK
ncbi:Uncharacterised protein [Ewingella americana]|uniref:Uncharacterized protein n=1 Tax=Ewingella americana TaxID=41202 RepID=A0A377NI26_9GAMM|nr:Uncharacterised protein [Ewingella americana]